MSVEQIKIWLKQQQKWWGGEKRVPCTAAESKYWLSEQIKVTDLRK